MKKSQSVVLFGSFLELAQNEKAGKVIDFDDNYEITAISSGQQHCCVITSSGDCFSIGSNKYGQLGLGTFDNAEEFKKIESNSKFVKVQCGNDFTIWKTSNNEFLIAGKSVSNHPDKFPLEISDISIFGDSICTILNQQTCRFYAKYFSNSFVESVLPAVPEQISCSSEYALALCQGSVFMLDLTGELTCIFNYCPKIVSMLSSSTYSMALDFQGNLYMLGDIVGMKRKNTDGKIASHVSSFFVLPKQAFYQTEKYQLYGFGYNEKGQLGDGTTKKRVSGTPINIEGIAIGISGNGDFTFIVQTPFNERLLSSDCSKLTPDMLSSPPESTLDLIP
ncbi:hypothetical protein TVAG_002930 [Trichomonas vaginalis G3]|uniref:Uncharacterized protein n=1 Tax=Trichomonas vaginalis (strain ATCC PRA-98 / G3) TaxID=412133 RepID=A2EZR6_TRIV3|nr:regulator of chromosome condensation 1/beta-lactamase-inhibitor protein II family [Trichomonas vaginalis G3]EAY01838.1 hypothetical protein TVAG_002930 [Trichomonas vaginalis G3]KAI5497564.1 regulator of chromosome condensation 1/beta-lactamase-inhibitor protein II family [Trichomonas vaginalis G3]|eukprot:XP_001314385.1 hypothetical protein [Trichomonas vaginalis G3]